jgi:uncharacterized membrane protein
MSGYEVLKFTYVALVLGFNASYGVWLAWSARSPNQLPHVLREIKVLDDRFANPAYALLLGTGLGMVWVGDLDLTAFWLALSLGLYGVLVVLGLAGYSPLLRRQIRVVETSGPDSPQFRRLMKESQLLSAGMAVVVIGILFLMVTKPAP